MSEQTRHHPRQRRRRLLKLGLSSPLLLPLQAVGSSAVSGGQAGTATPSAIAAVRIWPAREYTRVTLELGDLVPFKARMIDNPLRVMLDLSGLQVESRVRELQSKVSATDPFIRQVRIGQFTPETMRIVFDLKQPVDPQVFTLKPTGNYQHRLVLDFYPKYPTDPLEQLIAEQDARSRQLAQAPRKPGESKATTKPGQKAPRKSAPAEATRTFTVVLDPGHGGEDPGAIGPKGTYEKDVVLAVGKRVRQMLAKEENLRVVLTRDGDYFVPLAKRVSKARGVRADLFVSIHADAFIKPEARGSSVYVLSSTGASSLGAKWLAKRENNSDLIGGINIKTSLPETANLLMDLYTTSQIRDSRAVAKLMLSELGQVGSLHKTSVEQANFAVLRSPDVPSVLVETAFISNPEEEKRLRTPQYQEELARAISKGILDYRKANPPGPRGKVS
ncbi:MAG: N-acetylmuramoyl-L-alanine amidase [Lautropia sp.]|nr:N-acetylmuramoyl-L-alanine amidase [Lautropia sp.]